MRFSRDRLAHLLVAERWAAQLVRDWSVGAVLSVGSAGVVASGALDFAFTETAGRGVGLTGLYAFPVALTAWAGGRHAGWAVAVSAAVMEASVAFATKNGTTSSRLAVSGGVELLVFLGMAELLALLRFHFETERRLSRTDPLTGIANGRHFREAATLEIERARRLGSPLSLVYFDIDDFKRVNDTRGHADGDHLLRIVAGALHAAVRKPDLAARVGGDEFAVLLCGAGAEATRLAVPRVQAEVLAAMRASGFTSTLSAGAATFEVAPGEVDELLAAADAAMYEVKEGLKDGVRYAVRGAPAPRPAAVRPWLRPESHSPSV
jgi:diguanylate cyclase (GGDEF)-like protein